MIGFLSNELFAAVVRVLPRLFLWGAPVLAGLLAFAALADVVLPHRAPLIHDR